MPKAKHFTVEAGRQICMDGKPFITINKCGDTTPCAADEVTHMIAALLNDLGNKEIVTKYLGGYASQLQRLGVGLGFSKLR